MRFSRIALLVLSILLAEGAGLLGAFLIGESVSGWYETLVRPSWNPPNWIFGPVWSVLYALMGIAAWRVFLRHEEDPAAFASALRLYAGQLALNAIWSPLFFVAREIGAAFIEIVILWFAILFTIRAFWRIDRIAGYLLVPYILWVTFAAFLNYTIWSLN